MKLAFFTIFLLFAAVCFANGQDTASEIKRFREIREKAFRSPNETPLLREDFLNFKGLAYYDVNEKFAVKAKFETTADAQVFLMPTNTGTSRKYFKYGVLTFEIDGKSFSLTAFRSETSAQKNGSLFVPFRDLTSGAETYGGGRYLDIKAPADDTAVLDFNFAYNPACAYGRDDFSCALPPKENFLQTEIKAGEKAFQHSVQKP